MSRPSQMTERPVTAKALVKAITKLPKSREYRYLNAKNKGRILLASIDAPNGPIHVKRYNPSKGGTKHGAKPAVIPEQLIARIAAAIRKARPFNLDRIVASSYNTRSVLEALLAHTPQFHHCYPGRFQVSGKTSKVMKGHKHLIWLPDDSHKLGETSKIETSLVIAEHAVENVYEAVDLANAPEISDANIDLARRHAQIQVALIRIGHSLGCKSYIPKKDQGIRYGLERLGSLRGVVRDLKRQAMVSAHPGAAHAAAEIGCVWFREKGFMPAVIEIAHSEGVFAGLARMKSFRDHLPSVQTRFVVAASDDDRSDVFREAARPQFKALRPQFLSYSAIEELHWLSQRRNLRSCSDAFIDSFLEPIKA